MWSRSSLLLFAVSVFGQGVQFTVGSSGISALTHNGENRLGAFNVPSIAGLRMNGDLVNVTCTSSAITDGFRRTCNAGSPGHTVYDVTFGGAGTDTLAVTSCITNLDTLGRAQTQAGLDNIFSLVTTDSVLTEDNNSRIGNLESVAKYRLFPTYSAALYVTEFHELAWQWTSDGKQGAIFAGSPQQGSISIPNGQTMCSSVYVAFGTTSDGIEKLAKPGYDAYNALYPQIVWPDRRPIGLVFLAQKSQQTTGNPRAWNTSPATPDFLNDFATARTAWFAKTNIILDNADNLSARPQALCWWDWGGEEFLHVFTYVGYPGSDSGSHLFTLAPELEVQTNGVPLVDEIFNNIKARGYEPCMTLRPHKLWLSGNGRPTNGCYAQTANDGQAYLDLSENYPNRGYRCEERTVTFDDATDTVQCPSNNCALLQNGTVVRLYATSGTLPPAITAGQDYYIQNWVPNSSFQISTDQAGMNLVTDLSGGSGTFQAEAWRGPEQISSHEATHSYADALDMMAQAVRYAQNRWGVKIFYVDSTYYKTDGQIGRQNTTIGSYFWRELESMFPGTLFMPENSPGGAGYAKFLSTNLGTFRTSQTSGIMRYNRDGFSAIHVNGNYLGNDGGRAALRGGTQAGDIYLFSVNAPGTVEQQGLADRATALAAMRTITMTDRGQARTFRSDPGAAFRYPLISRVYFASSAEGLAASTTYCERKELDRCYLSGTVQESAALDLSTRPYYQIRYYDYAGGLVSNPGNYGVIQ